MGRKKDNVITVSEEEIARDARKAHAKLERLFKMWQAAMPEDKDERGRQLDQWILKLGESGWRMRRAEAQAIAARRKP